MHHSLVTLRALLYEGPDHRRWLDVCRALDPVPAKSLALALNYVEDYVAGWPTEVRWARPAWIDDVMRGRPQPRLVICRALDLAGRPMTSEEARALADAEEMEAITTLVLRGLDGAHLAVLLASPHFRRVERLELDGDTLDDHATACLARVTWRRSCVHLQILDCVFEASPFVERWPRLETLEAARCGLATDALADADLPALERLGMAMWRGGPVAPLARASFLGRIRQLDLGGCDVRGFVAELLGAGLAPRLSRLNLRDAVLDEVDFEAIRRATTLERLDYVDLRGTGAPSTLPTECRSLRSGALRV